MNIYFIRHAEPDYSFLNKNDNYSLANFAGLSKNGIEQALELKQYLKDLDLQKSIIISSPYTRALQTANIAIDNSKDIIVEFDLHEWFPSKKMNILVSEFKQRNYDYIKENYGDDIETPLEMKQRMENIIEKYINTNYENLIIFAHSRLIKSYLGCKGLDYCQIIKINSN